VFTRQGEFVEFVAWHDLEAGPHRKIRVIAARTLQGRIRYFNKEELTGDLPPEPVEEKDMFTYITVAAVAFVAVLLTIGLAVLMADPGLRNTRALLGIV